MPSSLHSFWCQFDTSIAKYKNFALPLVLVMGPTTCTYKVNIIFDALCSLGLLSLLHPEWKFWSWKEVSFVAVIQECTLIQHSTQLVMAILSITYIVKHGCYSNETERHRSHPCSGCMKNMILLESMIHFRHLFKKLSI